MTDSATEFESSMAPSTPDTKLQNITTEASSTIQDVYATLDVPNHRSSISIDAATKVILQGRLADLNYLIQGEEGLTASQDLQHLILRVLNEIETWLNEGGTMNFEAQIRLSNVMYSLPEKNIHNQYLCKDEECLVATYLSRLRSATVNGTLSDLQPRISPDLLREYKAIIEGPEIPATDKVHQDQLDLLHIRICDSSIAFHSIETAIWILDKGQQVLGSSELSNQADELSKRLGEATANGLERAIAMRSKTVAFTPLSNPDRPRQLSRLGNCYRYRFLRFGEEKDMDFAIKRQREAVASTPLNSAVRPGRLHNLASLHKSRFERFEDVKDLDSGIEQHLEAVASTPLNCADRPERLSALASFYHTRFERLWEKKDIDSSIKHQSEAVASKSADRPERLMVMAFLYQCRFERFGELKDIDSAIKYQLEAVASTPLNSADRPGQLNTLGGSYHHRFRRSGDVKDLESAIKQHLQAVTSTPINSADRPKRLTNLALAYESRFEQFGEGKDLELAIEQQREAVASTPLSSADRPTFLRYLGNSYIRRFERFGDVKDLEWAIERHREALASTPLDSANRAGQLNDLASSYQCRFEQFGDLKDLESAIEKQLEAVASTPINSVDRPDRLTNLAIVYQKRFERFGEVKDLQSAIEKQREAVATSTPLSADRPGQLNNLTCLYRTRFERFGDVNDLESAIEQQLEVVASNPLHSARQPAHVHNLAMLYRDRFERFGEVKDLDSAIKQELDAVASTPLKSIDRPGRLHNLAIFYRTRFKRFQDVKDLELATEHQLEAVASIPLNSPGRPALLDALASSYQSCFQVFENVKYLALAIEHQSEAVAYTPLNNPERPLYLNNLANLYQCRFEGFGDLKDLELAIREQLEAIASTPFDSANRPRYLNNLAIAYQYRFERLGDVKDIESAIEHLLDANACFPPDSVGRSMCLNNLGKSYQIRFDSTGELSDLEKAVSHFRLSSMSRNGSPYSRIKGCLRWANLTWLHNLRSTSEAYDQAIHLLPQVVWIGLSATSQLYHLITDIQELGCDAAACMIALAQAESHNQQHHLGHAIELLDQGRSILWSQTSNFKRDLEELQEVNPQLASDLDNVGKALGQGCFRDSTDTLSEADAQSYRRSAEKWEELVHRVRDLPGFNNFLLPSPISTLRTAAADGPVVIINSSRHRCDALIIPPQGDLVLVPLPDITAEEINTLTNQQEKFATRQSRVGIPLDDEHEPTCITTLESVLNQTWLLVGEPVVLKIEELGLLGSGTSTTCRIWWCLTGLLSFLPIHASFPPNKSAIGMMDVVVSSYTPTISALLRAQQKCGAIPTFRMLAVGQSKTSGMISLPGVAKEIAFISKKLGANTQILEESKATVDEVAGSLQSCSWAHFACHGVQEPDEPMGSGLVLWNGHRLTLSRLAQSPLASAEFAFLSCCQSAKGSKELPNEAVHLAAGLQFIGFRGVIGTMWSVGDNDALSIAVQVYEELFKDGTSQVSPSKAALALHQAVCYLRNCVPLDRWVPFVHFGL